jgi:predicted metal-dependent HD superfamily phosphohydrolase
VTVDVRDLKSRFDRAALAAGATRARDAFFADLVARYREPHRHYHTLDHIDACLSWLDRFWAVAERPDEVALALWFHDAIYTPGATDNERQSARLACDHLGALGIDAAKAGRVARYIEATKHVDPTSGDAGLVVDLDLTILGAPARDFEVFERQIRREYVHVPDAMYRLGRGHVLQRFASRPHIYQVPQLREQLEAAARANLERRIATLSA